jgi:hypothetical protein
MNHIQSPQPGDEGTEAMIKALGADAPRVTPEDLAANIAHTEYVKHIAPSGQVLRWCVLTALNGFAVTGRPSVSVSPENDRPLIGEKVAYENAINEMWPLMGYELKQRLHGALAQGPERITDSLAR